MTEEHFFWCVALELWVFNEAREVPKFFPPIVRQGWVDRQIFKTVTRKIRKQGHASGIGRHSQEEVENLGRFVNKEGEKRSFTTYVLLIFQARPEGTLCSVGQQGLPPRRQGVPGRHHPVRLHQPGPHPAGGHKVHLQAVPVEGSTQPGRAQRQDDQEVLARLQRCEVQNRLFKQLQKINTV